MSIPVKRVFRGVSILSNECPAKCPCLSNERSAERPTADVVDFYLYVIAWLDDAAFFRLEDDLLEVVRLADKFSGVACGICFDENFFGSADHHLVALERNCVLEFHEARVAGELFFGRENFRFFVRFGAFARAVDEHVRRVELARFECFDSLFEIFFGLADKSADDVCRNGVVRVAAAQLLDDGHVLLHVVLAAHLLEDGVGAALERDVRVMANFRIVQKNVDEFVRVVARMRACKADALDAADFGDLRQKRREVFGSGLVGVNRLAKQHHFGNALVGGSADFGENVVCFAVFLGTAEVRHDAVAATLVATALDGDESAEVVAQLGVVAEVVLVAVFVDEHLVVRLVQRAVGVAEQKLRNFAVLVRAYDVVHVLEALEQFRAAVLGHATANDDFHVGILFAQVLELADVRDGGFLGFFAYAAGVHDDDVGVFLVVRLDTAAHV